MNTYTLLDGLQRAAQHVTLPRGVTPAQSYVEGQHPLGMQWNGTEFVAYVPPPPAPPPPLTSITPRQARLALLGAGLLEQIQAAFAELPEPQKTSASIEWEYASSIERSSPLVAQMAAVAGLTDEQVDALFTAGAAL